MLSLAFYITTYVYKTAYVCMYVYMCFVNPLSKWLEFYFWPLHTTKKKKNKKMVMNSTKIIPKNYIVR